MVGHFENCFSQVRQFFSYLLYIDAIARLYVNSQGMNSKIVLFAAVLQVDFISTRLQQNKFEHFNIYLKNKMNGLSYAYIDKSVFAVYIIQSLTTSASQINVLNKFLCLYRK